MGIHKSLLIFLLISALISISISGSGCLSDSMGDVEQYMQILPFGNEKDNYRPDIGQMTVPLPYPQDQASYESKPRPNAFMHPGFEISSRLEYMGLYQTSTAVVNIYLKNEGHRDVFIYNYGIRVEENSVFADQDTGITIPPGEERNIGMMGIDIPGDVNFITIRPGVSMLSMTESGKWFDCKEQIFDGIELDLLPLPEKQQHEYTSNTPDLFEMANSKIDSRDIGVREIAADAAKKYPGTYNIYQICSIFDNTKENIQYISDPRGSDHWAVPAETLQIGAGDCDDYATLMASLVEAIGGTSRIYLTDDHAFAAVYIGNDTQQIEEISDSIRQYYGPVPVYYSTDEYGSWLMLDPTSSMYPGDLPGGTAPTESGWTYLDTRKVTAIDIIPA